MNHVTCSELNFVLMRLPHVRAVLFVGGHGHCTHVHDNSCRERYSCFSRVLKFDEIMEIDFHCSSRRRSEDHLIYFYSASKQNMIMTIDASMCHRTDRSKNALEKDIHA